VRVSIASPLAQPCPNGRRVGSGIVVFGRPDGGMVAPEAIPEETGENPDLEASDALGCERQRG